MLTAIRTAQKGRSLLFDHIDDASHDTIPEETPVENVLAMFDAVNEYGVY